MINIRESKNKNETNNLFSLENRKMSDGGSLSDAEFDVIDAINGNDAENNNLIPVNF